MTLPSSPVLGQIGTDESGRQYQCTDATNKLWDLISTLGPGINVQVFSTPGADTYTPSPGLRKALVFCTGAGAGGGGADSSGSGASGAGGGGESGGTAIKLFSPEQIGASATLAIGAGGTAGADTGGAGGDGGDTTFDPAGSGDTLTGGGGDGGDGTVGASHHTVGPGGSGEGVATGGDINIPGGDGENGFSFADTGVAARALGGGGGASFWGGGGRGASLAAGPASLAGETAAAPGAGGGGAADAATATGAAGGAGANGIIFVIEFVGDSVSTADIFDHLQEMTAAIEVGSDFALVRDDSESLNMKRPIEKMGGMHRLDGGTFSGNNVNIDMEYEGYSEFIIVLADIEPTADASIYLRTSSDSGATFPDGASTYSYSRTYTITATVGGDGQANTYVDLATNVEASANGGCSIIIHFPGTRSTANYPKFFWQARYYNTSGAWIHLTGGGNRENSVDIDQVQIGAVSSTIARGTWTLYGVKS